jgi:hypothetical protein
MKLMLIELIAVPLIKGNIMILIIPIIVVYLLIIIPTKIDINLIGRYPPI